MLRAPAVLILILAPLWAAWAQDDAVLPAYDVAAYCDRLAGAQGEGNFVRDDCLAQEQECIDKLKSAWSGIPAPMRSMCHDTAEAEGSSYTQLYYCLVAEYEAEQGYAPF